MQTVLTLVGLLPTNPLPILWAMSLFLLLIRHTFAILMLPLDSVRGQLKQKAVILPALLPEWASSMLGMMGLVMLWVNRTLVTLIYFQNVAY